MAVIFIDEVRRSLVYYFRSVIYYGFYIRKGEFQIGSSSVIEEKYFSTYVKEFSTYGEMVYDERIFEQISAGFSLSGII